MKLVRYADRVELLDRRDLSEQTFPEFVRPTWKERYPLIPIERYLLWRRDDGSHFDPWLRVHERVGGEIVAPAPESMLIEVPVADWEQWTEMRFPDDGRYVFPGGLARSRSTTGSAAT